MKVVQVLALNIRALARNYYEMSKEWHDKLYYQNVTQTYQKMDNQLYNKINMEAKSIAEDLNLSDRIEYLAQTLLLHSRIIRRTRKIFSFPVYRVTKKHSPGRPLKNFFC